MPAGRRLFTRRRPQATWLKVTAVVVVLSVSAFVVHVAA